MGQAVMSKNANREAAWVENLREAGHAIETRPLMADATDERPWYLTLILALSAWFSAFFLMFFVALAVRPDTAVGAGVIAILMLCAAALLMFQARDVFFLQQVAFALSLTAQALMCWPMYEFAGKQYPSLFFAQLLAFQLLLAVTLPYRVHRSLSFFFAAIAWICVVRFWDHNWDSSMRAISFASTHVRIGIAVLPMLALLTILLQREPEWVAKGQAVLMRPLLIALVIAVALLPGMLFLSMGFFGDVHNISSTVPILGILCALIGAAAAFQLRTSWLIAFAFACAFLNLLSLYYSLGTSLLEKSAWALAIGVLALIPSFALKPDTSESAADSLKNTEAP
jgi:Domain of unknown function (DUF4401)